MAKLSTMRPAIGRAPPSVGWAPKDTQERSRYREAQPWRKWYKTKRWQALRDDVLLRDRYTCQMPGCGIVIAKPSHRIADHVIAHRGDERLFWDVGNLQTLCKACHDGRKQRQEHGR